VGRREVACRAVSGKSVARPAVVYGTNWRQTRSNNPQEQLNSELAERVYRPEVCSCSRITSGLGRAASRFGPVSQPVRTSIAARARGRHGGRPSVMTAYKAQVARGMYHSGQYTVTAIATTLGVSRASIYRHLSVAR
jgi:hypothetical protein